MKVYKAWMSIGVDDHPIEINWYKDHLQSNVRRIPVSIIRTRELNKLLKVCKSLKKRKK